MLFEAMRECWNSLWVAGGGRAGEVLSPSMLGCYSDLVILIRECMPSTTSALKTTTLTGASWPPTSGLSTATAERPGPVFSTTQPLNPFYIMPYIRSGRDAVQGGEGDLEFGTGRWTGRRGPL